MGSHSSAEERSTGQLVGDLSQQVSTLVRSEIRLAQLELQQKGKLLGIGVGLFGAAGLLALYGLGGLIATAILALALVVDAWLAALIVTLVVFAAAGVAALVGKKEVSEATPLAPEAAIDSTKKDVETVKGASPAMTEPDEKAQVEAEIEQTRRELGDTVDELSAKLDVKGRAQEKVAEGKAAVQSAGQRAVDAARERPAAAYGAVGALVAVTVGVLWWLVRR